MRPDAVILSEPFSDDGSGLIERCEPLRIQHFMAQGSIEPFIIAVLPRRARIDADGRNAGLAKPSLKGFGGELGSIIGPDIVRFPVLKQERIEGFKNVFAAFYVARTAGALVLAISVWSLKSPKTRRRLRRRAERMTSALRRLRAGLKTDARTWRTHCGPTRWTFASNTKNN